MFHVILIKQVLDVITCLAHLFSYKRIHILFNRIGTGLLPSLIYYFDFLSSSVVFLTGLSLIQGSVILRGSTL